MRVNTGIDGYLQGFTANCWGEVEEVAVWKCASCGYEKEARCKPQKCPQCGSKGTIAKK